MISYSVIPIFENCQYYMSCQMRNTEKHCSVNTKVKVEKAIKFNQIKILVLFQNKFNLVITIKIIDLVEVYSISPI